MSERTLDFLLYYEDLNTFSKVKSGLEFIKKEEVQKANKFFQKSHISDFSKLTFEGSYTSKNFYSGRMLVNPHGENENSDYIKFFKDLKPSILICTFTEDFGSSRSYAYQNQKKISAKRARNIIIHKDPNIAFQIALAENKTGDAKKLVDKIDLKMKIQGYPLFHYIAKNVHSARPLLNLLLDRGIKITDIDQGGNCVVHAALNGGKFDSYTKIAHRVLKENENYDIHRLDSNGNSILSKAIYASTPLVKLLLDRGADPNISGERDITPLAAAIKEHIFQTPTIIKLLDHGANINNRSELLGNIPFVFFFMKESAGNYFYETDEKKKKSILGKVLKVTKKLVDLGDDIFYVDELGGNILGYINGVEDLRNICKKFGLIEPRFPNMNNKKSSEIIAHYILNGESDKLIEFFHSEKFTKEKFGDKLWYFKYISDLGLKKPLEALLSDFNNLELANQKGLIEHFVREKKVEEILLFLGENNLLKIDSRANTWSESTFWDLIFETGDNEFIRKLKTLNK